MADASVMLKLEGLNMDLEAMADIFARIIKAARIPNEAGGKAGSGIDLAGVLLESLIARASSALDKVGHVNRALTLGNSDKHVYEKVKSTQHRLTAVNQQTAKLFTAEGQTCPALELQQMLAQLLHVQHASAAGGSGATATPVMPSQLAELCSQALHSSLQPRVGGSRAPSL